jgi:hypothetical protein
MEGDILVEVHLHDVLVIREDGALHGVVQELGHVVQVLVVNTVLEVTDGNNERRQGGRGKKVR